MSDAMNMKKQGKPAERNQNAAVKVMLCLRGNIINGNRNRGDDEEGHCAKDKCHAAKNGAAFAIPMWRREVVVVVWAHGFVLNV
jgi:hypothetical protein